ncbi:hypothetical protein [Desulfosarcina cetonica]|uniref:hypothetical protein n=1 Tax=Desulfosarcina cetonica TaxID=90730 RepID=UPI0006D06DE8|nr:hypothetical protein [Desulfosarcina cetonica]
MQIKRFEADDMNDALRQVKREFGDDAVILSAKEVRPGGFFSALRKKQVVITAAMDYQAKDVQQRRQFSGILSQQMEDDPSPRDHVSLSRSATEAKLPPAARQPLRRSRQQPRKQNP